MTQRKRAKMLVRALAHVDDEVLLELRDILAATQNPGTRNDGSISEPLWILMRNTADAAQALRYAANEFRSYGN